MTKEDLIIGRRYYYYKYDHSQGVLKITSIDENKVHYEVEETGTFFRKKGEVGHFPIFCAIRDFEPCYTFKKCPLCK